MLVIIASPDEPQWDTITSRSLWLVPRLWLITIKVTALAIVVPYAVLHIGSAVILTWWETYAAAKMIVALTAVSFVWVPFVIAYCSRTGSLRKRRRSVGLQRPVSIIERGKNTGFRTGMALRRQAALYGLYRTNGFVAPRDKCCERCTVNRSANAGLITIVAESLCAVVIRRLVALLWELSSLCIAR